MLANINGPKWVKPRFPSINTDKRVKMKNSATALFFSSDFWNFSFFFCFYYSCGRWRNRKHQHYVPNVWKYMQSVDNHNSQLKHHILSFSHFFLKTLKYTKNIILKQNRIKNTTIAYRERFVSYTYFLTSHLIILIFYKIVKIFYKNC